MEKVAFLNLTYNSFNDNSTWKKFFDQGNKDTFNFYIHPKKQGGFFTEYHVPNPVPTAWGHFSLVEATIELMKAALEDEENEYFTLISDSHFPLYKLDETVELIKNKYKKTTFAKHFSFHTKVKSQKILREGVIAPHPFDEYNAVCQFFVCRRKDVMKFVATFQEYAKFFVKNKVIFADEFYFWAVAKDLKLDFDIGQATTYSDWSMRLNSEGGQDRNPRAFDKLDQQMIQDYRNKGFLYARKIMSHTFVLGDPFK